MHLFSLKTSPSYPTTFRLIRPSIPRTRIYTRLRGDGKGQYIFISWSRVYLSRLAKNSARLGCGLLERTMQGLPAMAYSTLESHWKTLSATDSNSILTRSSIQENHRCSLVVVHFGVILGDSPIVALSDVGYSGRLAVMAVIARDILANTAQEQAHVFRATMMLHTGCLTGVPCCAGAGSRGTKPWRGLYPGLVPGPRLPRLEGRARDTSGPPGPSGFDP